jgi:hypothetical protein
MEDCSVIVPGKIYGGRPLGAIAVPSRAATLICKLEELDSSPSL